MARPRDKIHKPGVPRTDWNAVRESWAPVRSGLDVRVPVAMMLMPVMEQMIMVSTNTSKRP